MSENSFRSETSTNIRHSVFWWVFKVVSGTMLIASLFLMYLYEAPRLFDFPRTAAQLLVLCGGLTTVWHYRLLRKSERNVQNPSKLIKDQALFRWIRHPMYAGDILTYTGLVVLAPNIVTVCLLPLSIMALVRQARIEDKFLAQRFGARYASWRSRTGLLFPRFVSA